MANKPSKKRPLDYRKVKSSEQSINEKIAKAKADGSIITYKK